MQREVLACFYGEQLNQPLARELTVPEIDRIASWSSRPHVVVAFGGGEPFLRADLPDVAAIFIKRNRPRLLTIVTNGIIPIGLKGSPAKSFHGAETPS